MANLVPLLVMKHQKNYVGNLHAIQWLLRCLLLTSSKVRTLIIQDFDKQFQKVDAIIGPTSPTTALPLGATEGQSMFGELEIYVG
jgi:Asp-tRNA(Asn)/Glu-tRNA(Gln) amidotransferase A subunit family amidase